MLKKDVKIGGVYTAKVTNRLVQVRIDSVNRHGGWEATNLSTRKKVRIKSPQRLRAAVGDDVAKVEKSSKKATVAAEPPQTPTSPPTCEDTAKSESLPAVCPNCGASEFDEDGDCAKCREPKPTKQGAKATKPRATRAKAERPKRTSGLDAAARVLEEAAEPLGVKQIVEIAELKGYWKSPGGQTPAATIYSAMLREIKTKGDDARFRKTDRGKFAHA